MLLTRSFVHLPGIGAGRELKLWQKGIHHWDQLAQDLESHVPQSKRELAQATLKDSHRALKDGNLRFFYERLPRDQRWRVIPGRFEKVAYLDIETTGLGFPPQAESTTITVLHRGEVLQEHEHQAKKKLLEKIIRESEILVTFFGDVFDLPFLSREYDLEFKQAQVDLCFWLQRLGYKGGLKKVQKQFTEIPLRESSGEFGDLDGYDAVRLWRLHQKGVTGALETLFHYNAEDTVVLEPLLALAFNLEIERQGKILGPNADLASMGLVPMKVPKLAGLRTKISEDVYRMVKGRA